jgi:hypothetical protein
MTKAEKAEQGEAIERLRTVFHLGDTVRTVMRHVSDSGMSRSISIVDKDCDDISGIVSTALDRRFDRNNGGVKMGGCGMDLGFALVYELSSVLFPEGFDCIGDDREHRCPSCDHSNGDRDYSPDHHHKDGGYALRQRWV